MGSLAGAGAAEISLSSDGVGAGGDDRGDSADFGEDEAFGDGDDFGDADGASLAMAMPIMATEISASTLSFHFFFPGH